jgi:predicted DNA-binding transcriptional regulator YafY
MRQLAASWSAIKRDITFMRDRLQAPIDWDRSEGGYRYKEGTAFEIPGFWLSAGETHALMIMREVWSQIQPGYLADQLAPLGRRLDQLAKEGHLTGNRIVVRAAPLRPVNPECFSLVASATTGRRRLAITYFGRNRNEASERIVSPQLLIHYRGTWYLDAWCHTREEERRFSLDCILKARIMTAPAIDQSTEILLDTYGIYPGPGARTATLHFDAEASRWVADEEWHPRQIQTHLEDGSLILKVPFDHPQELLMDVLRHGKHVEVLEPADLREAVISNLEEARAGYDRPDRKPPQVDERREICRAFVGT